MRNAFLYFNSSPEVIRLTVMMYIRFPLSLRQVEDLLFERGAVSKQIGLSGAGELHTSGDRFLCITATGHK